MIDWLCSIAHQGDANIPAGDALTTERWAGVQTMRDGAAQPPVTLVTQDIMPRPDPTAAGGDGTLWSGRRLSPQPELPPVPQAPALLVNMMRLPDDRDEELNAWYETEHLPRLRDVPGLLLARRFRSDTHPLTYAAVYHLADIAVPSTPAWADAATTPWTRRIQGLRLSGARYLLARAG